ncbi:MAG: DNA translocase FtsK [Chloroflexi bacterium]|nr:DNA translocase FtsK [Chloroflexota bacterium]
MNHQQPQVKSSKDSPLSSTDRTVIADQFNLTGQLLKYGKRYGWDIGGVTALAFALMTLLALLFPELTSGILDHWANFLRLWLGWGSLWIAAAGLICGIFMLRHRHFYMTTSAWGQVFAGEIAAFCTLILLASLGGYSIDRADAGMDGGRIGWALAYITSSIFTPLGIAAKIIHILITSLFILIFAFTAIGVWRALSSWIRKIDRNPVSTPTENLGLGPVISVAPLQAENTESGADIGAKKRPLQLPAEFRKKFTFPAKEEQEAKPVNPLPRDERLPPLQLLVYEHANRPDERHINLAAGLIEKTLSEFGIPAKVISYRVGPTVTQFAVEPGFLEKGNGEGEGNRQKVRVAQIASLNRDLALALSAERLRIEAPVPGRPYIGIEVPNTRSTVVRLRPILETEAFNKIGTPLAIALGRDVSGQPVVADLGKMPHLLIAGTTGSGKSVCIAAITTCLVMNNAPEDLRLVMIDPKMVELIRFNGLPHLYGNVETNLERILGVLRWAVSEMDRRYRLLELTHSRNLDSYNRKIRKRKGEENLPHIVILIDELADLMMSAPEQTEPALIRLAQMARATGIHLIVATQRPSTDVVTGLIKANFPARLSFAVASGVDSRVILDTAGAETLLGHGDMLFLPPEASGPIRAQGVMVTDQEVEKVIIFWQKTAPQREGEQPPWEEMLQKEAVLADRDDLVEQAIKIVRETQRASASLLQRRLRIGYPRAARLVDELEELGVIGPSTGGGRERQVLIPKDEDSVED